MKVIGIDPGLQVSGYAVIEPSGQETRVLDAGIIHTDGQAPLAERLDQLYQDFNAILSEHEPRLLAIEELYAHYKHPRTAILMGHARGVFLVAAAQHMIPVENFTATRVKKSLIGYGRASKEQMQNGVMSQLGLAKLPTPADVADALAIALCALGQHQREKLAP